MRIASGFTTGIISNLVRRLVRKKAGYDIDILLNSMDVSIKDGKTHVHLDLDATMEKDELLKLLKNIGLN